MSLVAKRQMTDARLAAARANGKLSGGPATTEGRQRICDAHLIHGYYAQGERETLSALGEDPKDLDELREELREIWSPVNRFEEELVGRLARALWRMKRAARVQEALAAREVRKRMQVLEDLIEIAAQPRTERKHRARGHGDVPCHEHTRAVNTHGRIQPRHARRISGDVPAQPIDNHE